MPRTTDLSRFCRALLVESLPPVPACMHGTPGCRDTSGRDHLCGVRWADVAHAQTSALNDHRCVCGSHRCRGRCEPGRDFGATLDRTGEGFGR